MVSERNAQIAEAQKNLTAFDAETEILKRGFANPTKMEASPLYKFQEELGSRNINRELAARGLYNSGAGWKRSDSSSRSSARKNPTGNLDGCLTSWGSGRMPRLPIRARPLALRKHRAIWLSKVGRPPRKAFKGPALPMRQD